MTTTPLNKLAASELMKYCSDNLETGLLGNNLPLLETWHKHNFNVDQRFKQQLLKQDPMQWDDSIEQHRAHYHKWYDFIASEIDIDNMASFLLENLHYPTFIKLLEKILSAQFLDDAKAAVQENIDDELEPEPHAQLMWKLMMAVKQRAQQPVKIDAYDSLHDRTLIFYYGYFIEPWHLVGSLFATEQMGTHRVIQMKTCLERLGLNQDELAFTIIHSECDDHHADDWLQRVIAPSIDAKPKLLEPIASGIADCLESSAMYLDYILKRTQNRMALKNS